MEFRFELLSKQPGLRRGRYHTPHGTFETPCFAPVGTYASLKGLTPEQIRATGTELILANSYHLHLRPTAARVSKLGGLHRFMGWDGPILTDSGGYWWRECLRRWVASRWSSSKKGLLRLRRFQLPRRYLRMRRRRL